MPIETLIRNYILENFLYSDDESLLTNEGSLLEQGIVDSTGVVELVMFIEETFCFEVADEDVIPEYFDSVERLARYVRLHTSQESSESVCVSP
ncbi:MAG: acyl carrier protein [Chloroflexi bacterium]|nr:acyl carrier protein [Chloroflexota bacterium]